MQETFRDDITEYRVFLKVFSELLEEKPSVPFEVLLTEYVVAHRVEKILHGKSNEEKILAARKLFDAFASIK